ncbi:MAG: phosphoribosyltransferase family protein [Bacteroidota bacterium]|mgnify:CR=1 FL=1
MFHDRKHGARLLAEILDEYKDSDAVIVAISRGGVPIGYHLANSLHLPLDIISSKQIKDPAHSHLTIGSVSLDGLDLIENNSHIPQDYIYHQTSMIKFNLHNQYKFYRGNEEPIDVKDKIVILVDDKLTYENQILACLRSIRNHQPRKIIVASPVVSTAVRRRLDRECCEISCLMIAPNTAHVETFYEVLPKVTDEEVKRLLENSKGNYNMAY